MQTPNSDGVENICFESNEEGCSSAVRNNDVSDAAKIKVAETEVEKTGASLTYSIEDTPPWYISALLGFQHYMVALGGIIGFPIIISRHLCVPDDEVGNVSRALLISSIFFVAGVCTLLQSTVGVRLPILQGGSFSFLPPALAILSLEHNLCPPSLPLGYMNSSETLYNDTDGSIVNGNELWQRRMRELQGAIAVASILQLILGASGAIGFTLRFIGPLTIAPSIALIGLDLFSTASGNASAQWGIAMFTAVVLVICSQYLKNIDIPLPAFSMQRKCHISRVPVFKMFPVLFALASGWILCYIFTVTNVLPTDSNNINSRARTDFRGDVIQNSPWFNWPYPGQWGLPKVTVAGVVGMLAGVIAGFVESIGDYYACARLSGAPIPPKHAINRGILTEGFGCVLAGVIGTGTGTTSYSENIGAIGITRVGSRRVLQVTGILLIILGVLSKFGSIFVTIPDPVIGGLFCVTFGMIAAVGISNLQYVDLNSARNLFIIGSSLFMGLTVPEWMKANRGVIQTSIPEIDQIITVLLQTSMLVGGILAFVFDNTIPGTERERGIIAWRSTQDGTTTFDEKALIKRQKECYDLPFPTNCCRFSKYLPFLPEFDNRNIQISMEVEEDGVDRHL